MKKTTALLLALLMCLSCSVMVLVNVLAVETSAHIYTIVTNPGENCNTSMNVAWHADFGYEKCYVSYTEKSDTEWKNAKKQDGTFDSEGYKIFNGRDSIKANGTLFTEKPEFLDYGATLSGLNEATWYKYKIYDDDGNCSGEYSFKTAGTEKYSFSWISDAHSYDPEPVRLADTIELTEELKKVAKYETEFVLSTGDTLALGGSYSHWQTFFNTDFIKNYMFANITGNHDVYDRRKDQETYENPDPLGVSSSDYFGVTHYNPRNAYTAPNGEDMNGKSYWYMYNDVLFIMFDHYNMLKSNANWAAGFNWAGGVIESLKGQYKYLVISNHLNYFNGSNGSDRYYSVFKGFCEKYNVDIALCGDNHIFTRTGSVYNWEKNTDPEKGTYYITNLCTSRANSPVDPTPIGLLESRYSISVDGVNVTRGGINIDVDENGMTFTVIVREAGIYKTLETFVIPVKPRSSDLAAGIYETSEKTLIKTTADNDALTLTEVPEKVIVQTSAVTADWGRIRYNGFTGWAKLGTAKLLSKQTEEPKISMFALDGAIGKGSGYNWGASFQAYLPSYGSTVASGDSQFLYQSMYVAQADKTTSGAYKVTTSIEDSSNKSATEIPADGMVFVVANSYTRRTEFVEFVKSGALFTYDSLRATIYPCNPGEENPVIDIPETLTLKMGYEYIVKDKLLTGIKADITVKSIIEAFDNTSVTVTGKDGKALGAENKVGTGAVISCIGKDNKPCDSVTVILNGDTDGTGTLEINDYVQIKMYFKGNDVLKDLYLTAADVNGDGKLSITDYLMIKRHIETTYDLYKKVSAVTPEDPKPTEPTLPTEPKPTETTLPTIQVEPKPTLV